MLTLEADEEYLSSNPVWEEAYFDDKVIRKTDLNKPEYITFSSDMF